MLDQREFAKLFNADFWRAFNSTIYSDKPTSKSERNKIVSDVYNSIRSGSYSPGIPHTEIIRNKGFGVARIVPVFSMHDYCIYYFCIKELEDILCVNRVENTFGGWTLGGKIRKKENAEIENELTQYGRYSFNPRAWSKAFKEFSSILFSQLEATRYSIVIQFDLSNFYDSIRLDILERKLRDQTDRNRSWIIALLFYFLNNWNRKNTGLYPQAVGLPQDALADCSRILANFYLQEYDSFAKKIADGVGGQYLRYSDDQMILTNNKKDVEYILLAITKKLDHYGLRVNQKKIQIWDSSKLIENRCHDIQKIMFEDKHYKNPSIIEKFANEILSIPPTKLKMRWNSGYPLLNKILYTDLENIDLKVGKKIYSRLTDREFLLLSDSRKLGIIYKFSKKYSSEGRFIKKLETIIDNSIHNAFHLECLSFAKEHGLANFRVKIEKRLIEISSLLLS